MIGKLVRCVTCNEVVNIIEWDSYPEYVWNDGDMEEIHVDDTDVFFQRHKGDQLEVLTPVSGIISNKPYVEPVKDCYFEATNGTERFLIKKWRSSIDQPFTYEIISGRLEISTEKMLVQVEAIRKQIRMENVFILLRIDKLKKIDRDSQVTPNKESPAQT